MNCCYLSFLINGDTNFICGIHLWDPGADDIISPITEWVRTALGMTTGLVISIRIKFNYNNNSRDLIKRTILASAAILSISVGIIHLLLVKEHMTESYMWGIAFLSMGIPQIMYGMIMVLANRLPASAKTNSTV